MIKQIREYFLFSLKKKHADEVSRLIDYFSKRLHNESLENNKTFNEVYEKMQDYQRIIGDYGLLDVYLRDYKGK